MSTTTTHQEDTMNDTATISNTSAVATIDGDELATIHASDMADCLASYTRSAALIVDRHDLYVIREAMEEMAARYGANSAATRITSAISQTLDLGLR